ncbi:MAG: thiamine biosynthesis protein ThiS [Chloroflexota bacterium]|nr:thiamine biosynthesis protein ThiS [Chloroflexota bacterium]
MICLSIESVRLFPRGAVARREMDSVVAQSRELGGVEIELFGVPRLVAGERSLRVAGDTLAEAAADLGVRCPELLGTVLDRETGWLLDGYIFVVDERFTRDAGCRLTPFSAVLLVSSVAGG